MNHTCNQKELTIFLFQIEGFLNWTMNTNGRIELRGVEGRFLRLLIDFLGIPTTKLILNGGVIEFIQCLDRGIVDMAAGRFFPRPEAFYDVSTPYADNYVTFIVRKSVPLSTRFAFLYTFTPNTWLGFILVFILFPAFGILLMKTKRISYIRLCLQMLGGLLGQGFQIPNISLKIKIYFLFWLFFSMVITFSFSAVFFSFMVNPLKNPPVRNFQDLADAVKAGTHRVYMDESLFVARIVSSPRSDIQQLRKVMKKEDVTPQNFDYENAIIQGYVFIKQHLDMDLKFGLNPGIYISDDGLGHAKTSSYFFREGFCLKEKVNLFISRAWAAGLYQKILKDEQAEHNKASRVITTENSFRPLSLYDISGILIIFITGLIISSFVFIMEIIVYHCQKLF